MAKPLRTSPERPVGPLCADTLPDMSSPARWSPWWAMPPDGTAHGPAGWRMADEELDQEQLETQMETAVDAIRATVQRLLREGEVHPQIVVMAATRVAGGLGAAAALASGQDLEGLLDDLAEALRQAGREHLETLQAELAALPVAGSA